MSLIIVLEFIFVHWHSPLLMRLFHGALALALFGEIICALARDFYVVHWHSPSSGAIYLLFVHWHGTVESIVGAGLSIMVIAISGRSCTYFTLEDHSGDPALPVNALAPSGEFISHET